MYCKSTVHTLQVVSLFFRSKKRRKRQKMGVAASPVSRLQSRVWPFSCLARFVAKKKRETAGGLERAPDYFILIRKIVYEAVIRNRSFTYQGIVGVHVSIRPVHQQV